MGWLSDLFTAAKGAVNEAGEAAADRTALTRLDQEIREADSHLRKAREDLTKVIADRKMAENRVADIDQSIAQYEGYAVQAMEKGEEALALEVAEKIAELENDKTEAVATRDQLLATEQTLRADVGRTEKQLTRLKNSVQTVKAVESSNRARAAVTSRSAGVKSSMGDALNSLDRIKQRQDQQRVRMDAAEELATETSGAGLENKLKAAGIGGGGGGANDVLARLKARQGGDTKALPGS